MSSVRVGYLVADIVGAVRVSSASTALPQLRHVWLVSPPDVTVSHKPTPEHGGREGGGGQDAWWVSVSPEKLLVYSRKLNGRLEAGSRSVVPNEPLQN